ncbi:voltage-dependent calcium channel beta subunit-associated regulatory protein [Nerophis lumbriciformis]|uniref:voltage-dependent calcium channel beta subunit-associated regulatory protein n=1 Tax=Nerophis lumbriciformis TaxID=546530 RepID=UPI002ADF8CAB|nr:voltage-dependent calcium channel beta subunit-associated regulatory protein-like [Nerophis lumbriciformis]XP_061835769.1 voltage-dependent calcium channel beta subunit-associated regulatory protein-like [Nerophis lumbriciformis]
MSNDSPALTSLTENSTDVPVSAGRVENYALLLVLLSVFAGGTLVLLSLLLLFCHRCCMGGRRYSRASDDPEKTNTTYVEDSQPTHEITIRLDESDALSATSCHDMESERFVSTGLTGRRVSFNESALYEQERMAQEKGRRYTLTEGDFHHLKKARLTHLHLPPAPCDLKILTIMECDSTESSTANLSAAPVPKLPLSIYQPTDRRVPDWLDQSLSGGLPGDTHHSIVLNQIPRQDLALRSKRSLTLEVLGDRLDAHSDHTIGEYTQAPRQSSVFQFLSKLRRHASLEGAGPYFRRWKFDSSHRAASLDAKGSPKRRPFQRQRAASETTDHTGDDSSLRDDPIRSFPQTPSQTSGLQSLSAESLSQSSLGPSSIFLHRLNLEVGSVTSRKEELDECSIQRQESISGDTPRVQTKLQQDPVRRIDTGGVASESLEDDDLFEPQPEDSTRKNPEGAVRQNCEVDQDEGEDSVLGAEIRPRAGSGSSLLCMEAHPSLYKDIWSLRASLEQYASSDHSSTDRESLRSDAESVSSLGCPGARTGHLDSCLSQDLDDEPEAEGEAMERGVRGASGGGSEMGSFVDGEADVGNRKLLQMDSGYASIETPFKAPEDMRLFGTPAVPRVKTASERRLFFTSSGRKGTVCESTEIRLFQEELEDDLPKSTEGSLQEQYPLTKPQSQLIKPISQPSSPHRPRLHRRDYSIDEKTDALFNEFLRHDPRFDQQDSPFRTRHRSRVNLRKQWQRHKQYSDPGSGTGGRYSPSLERQTFTPLPRGDSASYPLDTRYHSTLSRIASAADEEASEIAAGEEAAKESTASSDGANMTNPGPTSLGDKGHQTSSNTKSTSSPPPSCMDPRVGNRNNNSSQQVRSSLTDKLAAAVEERLYGGIRRAELGQGGTKLVVTASHTASPDHSPK